MDDQILDEMLEALRKTVRTSQKRRSRRRHQGERAAHRDLEPEGLPPGEAGSVGRQGKSPDDFVRDVMGIDPQAVWACVQQIVDSRIRRPVTIEDVLGELERDGLVASAASMRIM
jgi:hypothetical protein